MSETSLFINNEIDVFQGFVSSLNQNEGSKGTPLDELIEKGTRNYASYNDSYVKNTEPYAAKETKPREKLSRIVKAFNPIVDSHIKATTIKSADPKAVGTEHFITKDGIYPPNSISKPGKCSLGKCSTADIVLDKKSAKITDVHAYIIYEVAFRCVSRDFIQFLKAMKDGRIKSLPMEVIRVIWSFVRPIPAIYLENSHFSTGTYIKLQHRMIQPGDRFSLGGVATLEILEVEGVPVQFPGQSWRPLVERTILEQFAIEDKSNGVINLDSGESWAGLKASMGGLMMDEARHEFAFSWVLVRNKKEEVADKDADYHILWSTKDTDSSLVVGRSQMADLMIANPEISRLHSTLSYSVASKNWWIRDGTPDKETLNGTWLDCRREVNGQAQESKRQIHGGDIIKIGDDMLQIEVFNNDSRSRFL